MTTDQAAHGLTLQLIDTSGRTTDQVVDLQFAVHANVMGFSAVTKFWSEKSSIDAFAAELMDFATTGSGTPSFDGAFDESLSMSLSSLNAVGHSLVRLELKRRFHPNNATLIVEYGSEPQLVIEFAEALLAAGTDLKGNKFGLYGHP